MRPSKENVFFLLARYEQEQGLPEDGPLSLFVTKKIGSARTHATQIAVRAQGDTVYARFSRLPFVRPYVFSRQALKNASLPDSAAQ